MQDQEELIFRKDIFWEGLPWEEIYACGDHDGEESVLPSRDRSYSSKNIYKNSELLVTTTRKVLGETKRMLNDLERKQSLLKDAESIADGTFNGRIEVDGNFSHELGGILIQALKTFPTN